MVIWHIYPLCKLAFKSCGKISEVILPLEANSELWGSVLYFEPWGHFSQPSLGVYSRLEHFHLKEILYVWLKSLRQLVNFVPVSRSKSLGYRLLYPSKWGILSQTCSLFEITNKSITTGLTQLLVREPGESEPWPCMETRGWCQGGQCDGRISGTGKWKAVD